MLDKSGCGSKSRSFLLLDNNPKPFVIHCISSFLKSNIYLSDDLFNFEGGGCCIIDLYSFLNLDKQFGDGFESIIIRYHGAGGIFHLARSDGSILIVQVLE